MWCADRHGDRCHRRRGEHPADRRATRASCGGPRVPPQSARLHDVRSAAGYDGGAARVRSREPRDRRAEQKIWWITYDADGRRQTVSSHSENRQVAEDLLKAREAPRAAGGPDVGTSGTGHL